jgi:peptidoglycan/xylan/chitin deacetylase (PgdA/CDA1 family)
MNWFFRSHPRDIVLLYHRIARISPDPWELCVTPEHFAQHLEVLRKWQRIRLAQVGSAGSKVRVAVTFDDGYADNLHEAAPLLEKYDTPATIFIATGYIGGNREFWWDELERLVFLSGRPSSISCSLGGRMFGSTAQSHAECYYELYDQLQPLPHLMRQQVLDQMLSRSDLQTEYRATHRCLTQDELVVLASSELFEVGAHTVTHPILAAQPVRDQYAELRQSRDWLEILLGRPVTSLSYPYGGRQHYTIETVRAARDLGFSRACSVGGRDSSEMGNLHELPRVNVTDIDGDAFERLLCH